MDKNFVHIDELFKKGLSDGEEPEQSGAWLRMQELLENELPVTAVTRGRTPYRRYFTALLLLISIGGGAYLLNSQYGKSLFSNETGSEKLVSTDNSSNQSSTAVASAGSGSILPVSTTSNTHLSESDVKNSTHSAIPRFDNSQKSNVSINKTTTHNTASSNNTKKNNNNSHQTLTSSRVNNVVASLATNNNKTDNANKKLDAAKKVKNNYNNKDLENTRKKVLKEVASGNLYASEEGNLLKEETDSINQVTVKESINFNAQPANTAKNKNSTIRKPIINSDTISRRRVAVKTLVPLQPIEIASISDYKVVPNLNIEKLSESSLYASGERAVTLVTLSKYQVHEKMSTPAKINEMMGQTKNTFSNMFDGSKNYYTALLMGGNYSVTNPSAWGLQVGLGFYYMLSERWTLGAEARYINRNLNNYNVIDKYSTYSNVTEAISGGNYTFNYDQNMHTGSYHIKNMNSIEVPLYLTYSLGKLSIIGGANVAYSFKLHPTVNNEINTSTESYTGPSSVFKLENESSRVLPTDFNSRFGLGYLLGAQYDINRKYTVDLRLTQLLWDNAATNISKQLSNSIFRTPSLQLGLNINFGKREKVIYMMDYKK